MNGSEETALMVLLISLAIGFGAYAIGVAMAGEDKTLGRGPYFFLLVVVIVITQILTELVLAGMRRADVMEVVLFAGLVGAVQSVLIGLLASARSISAGKGKSYAWYCLIPIANIYFGLALLFIAPRQGIGAQFDNRAVSGTRAVFD